MNATVTEYFRLPLPPPTEDSKSIFTNSSTTAAQADFSVVSSVRTLLTA